jgi:hypothetical protein
VVERILARVPEQLPAGRVPRPLLAAFLPGRLARLYARRIAALGHDPFAAGHLIRPAVTPLVLVAAWLRQRV